MTSIDVRGEAPPRPHRLLDPGQLSALPRLSERQLIDLVEACGLTGRGGAGFPTAIKMHAVATGRRKPVVVANGMEGEPLSHKDAVLLTRSPELVLDGLELVGRALNAHRMVLAVGPEIDPHPVFEAAATAATSRCSTCRAVSSPGRRARCSTRSRAARRCPGTHLRG